MSAGNNKSSPSGFNENLKKMEIKVKKSEISFRDAFWYDFKGCLYRNEAEFKFSMQNFRVKQGQQLLEIGAGSGRFTTKFVKRGAVVVALDLSRQSLKFNKEHSGCQCVRADMCHLPFKPNSFDKVVAMSCFQYLPTEDNRDKTLRSIKIVLRPSGQLLIQVHNFRFYDKLKKRNKINSLFKTPVT